MDSKQELLNLRDVIKDGRFSFNGWATYPLDRKNMGRLDDAYSGSLDKAKELHDAVLPRAWFQITRCAGSPQARATITTMDGPPTDYRAKDDEPARAWLLAILEALIAREATRP